MLLSRMKAKVDSSSCKSILNQWDYKFRRDFYRCAFEKTAIKMRSPVDAKMVPEMITSQFCNYLM